MEFKEFGNQNDKKALLIHGGYVSWKALNVQISELEKDYHVFVPMLDGHNSNDTSELESIELEASRILAYFHQQGIREIDVIYGASLGANIGLEIMCQSNNFAKYAFIESGALNINKFFAWLLTYVSTIIMYKGVRGNKFCERIIDSFLIKIGMPKSLYKDTKDLLKHMSKKTIMNIEKLVSHYHLKDSISAITTHCLIVYSSKEKLYMEKPYNKMKEMVKNMQIICIEGYNHGELSIGEPKKQIKMLREFIA